MSQKLVFAYAPSLYFPSSPLYYPFSQKEMKTKNSISKSPTRLLIRNQTPYVTHFSYQLNASNFTLREKMTEERLINQRRNIKQALRSHICHLQNSYPCHLSSKVKAQWLPIWWLISKLNCSTLEDTRISLYIHRKYISVNHVAIYLWLVTMIKKTKFSMKNR